MENIFTGKTVEEAVRIGLETLGVSESDAEVEVLDEGKKRLIGSKPAQVRITVKERTDGERAVEFFGRTLSSHRCGSFRRIEKRRR